MVTLIEIAVYALVLSGGTSLTCMGHDHQTVTCSNGLNAKIVLNDAIQYSDGTLADRDAKGFPRFSNGIHSWFESSGWLAFSNGTEVRRVNADLYKVGKNVECRTVLPNFVECKEIAHKR